MSTVPEPSDSSKTPETDAEIIRRAVALMREDWPAGPTIPGTIGERTIHLVNAVADVLSRAADADDQFRLAGGPNPLALAFALVYLGGAA